MRTDILFALVVTTFMSFASTDKLTATDLPAGNGMIKLFPNGNTCYWPDYRPNLRVPPLCTGALGRVWRAHVYDLEDEPTLVLYVRPGDRTAHD